MCGNREPRGGVRIRTRIRCGTVDPHRSFSDDPAPRWYETEPAYGDVERDRPGVGDRRFGDDAFRVPEPRGGARDPRYDGLPEAHERAYGGPGTFGEREPLDGTGARRHDTGETTGARRIDAGRTPLDSGPTGYDHTRAFGDPTVTAERQLAFDVSMPPLAPPAPPPPPGLGGPAGLGGQHGPRPGEPMPPLAQATAAAHETTHQHAEPIDRAALRRGPAGAARVGEGFYRTRRPLIAILFAVGVGVFEVPALRLLASAAFGDRVSGSGIVAGTLLMLGLPAFAMGLYSLVTGAGRTPGQASATDWLRPPVAYLTIGLALLVAAALAAA